MVILLVALMFILLMVIVGYSINGYSIGKYWCLLMDIGGYYSDEY
jgi:hypothetical protein